MPGRPATTSKAVDPGDGVTRASCGMLKFCYSAGLLARASHLVVNLEPIVLTDAPRRARSMCAASELAGGVAPRILGWSQRLQRLLMRHAAAVSASTNDTAWLTRSASSTLGGLYKWALVGRTEYDAIVVLDVDVDLFLYTGGAPPAAGTLHADIVRFAWGGAMAAFLNSSLELVATTETVSSPINSGVMLLKPKLATYRRGLRVLEHGFTRQYGWEGAGAPRKLLRLDNLPKAVAARMKSAEMLRCDCWDSVGAAGDQGFFIYNYLVLHEARTFAAAGPYTPWADKWPLSQRWVAHHFFYAHKPWAPWARCLEYT